MNKNFECKCTQNQQATGSKQKHQVTFTKLKWCTDPCKDHKRQAIINDERQKRIKLCVHDFIQPFKTKSFL